MQTEESKDIIITITEYFINNILLISFIFNYCIIISLSILSN